MSDRGQGVFGWSKELVLAHLGGIGLPWSFPVQKNRAE